MMQNSSWFSTRKNVQEMIYPKKEMQHAICPKWKEAVYVDFTSLPLKKVKANGLTTSESNRGTLLVYHWRQYRQKRFSDHSQETFCLCGHKSSLASSERISSIATLVEVSHMLPSDYSKISDVYYRPHQSISASKSALKIEQSSG
ncbi:hypothetical protein KP509_04G105700 [Ceratopteris richardii]|uniref:Uncharacterized protein n=1 Tax=Ceratopteris richardii TaxID=49495 RepID=A0A8T2UZY3_CERRI|nr:hypothetical protein KP509_04G105700 [Ceratopteris richardii]